MKNVGGWYHYPSHSNAFTLHDVFKKKPLFQNGDAIINIGMAAMEPDAKNANSSATATKLLVKNENLPLSERSVLFRIFFCRRDNLLSYTLEVIPYAMFFWWSGKKNSSRKGRNMAFPGTEGKENENVSKNAVLASEVILKHFNGLGINLKCKNYHPAWKT